MILFFDISILFFKIVHWNYWNITRNSRNKRRHYTYTYTVYTLDVYTHVQHSLGYSQNNQTLSVSLHIFSQKMSATSKKKWDISPVEICLVLYSLTRTESPRGPTWNGRTRARPRAPLPLHRCALRPPPPARCSLPAKTCVPAAVWRSWTDTCSRWEREEGRRVVFQL